MIEISLFASAVRPYLWEKMFRSVERNNVNFEVVFAGPLTKEKISEKCFYWPNYFRYIYTRDIKPAQCYEVARRECKGELVNWTADDCEYSVEVLDNVCEYWRSLENMSSVVSIKTNEDEGNNDLNDHRFFGSNYNTPLMAPLGVMSRKYLDYIGGLDKRYICGQYENDIVMRVISKGGKVHKFEDGCVDINHLKKHGKQTKFWNWYKHDRKILETSWVIGGPIDDPHMSLDLVTKVAFYPIGNKEVSLVQLDQFEPYENKDLLTVGQSYKGEWE